METEFFYKKKRNSIVKSIVSTLVSFITHRRWRRYAKAVLRFLINVPLRIYIGVIAVCLFVGGVCYVLFFSGYFSIQTIVVESNTEYIRGAVEEYFEEENQKTLFGFVPRTTIFSSFGGVEKKIRKENPIIHTMDISFELPNTMYVKVISREHEGIWCSTYGAERCFFYSKDGVIFEEAPNTTRGFLLRFVRDARENEFELGDTVLTEQERQEVDLLYKALGSISEQPAYISIQDVQEIRAGFFGGWEAYFSRKEPLVAQVENIEHVLNKIQRRKNELGYIDARFGNRLFHWYKTTPVPQNPVPADASQPEEEE
ncbi:MAG: hypothetical protein F4X82_00345 [Candidatus Spechtbacteria bacterium SB0662_bin_43]|uniref:FtsQ-type POTRA domain-containing protein n=1 Tax=Candidatus Spechtbacteria bacterium SB0662_bin_43 TaxID=2604897 RepID=A0A845DA92_9BACT|nr:hypothetical protein [Candidatus Spechtbacteria bacterium SB0662_bin_43]